MQAASPEAARLHWSGNSNVVKERAFVLNVALQLPTRASVVSRGTFPSLSARN